MRTISTTISLLLVLIYSGCKKNDNTFIQNNELEKKFLTVTPNVPNAVKRVAETIKEQNEKFHFLNKFIKEQGFAKWDKSPVIAKPEALGLRTTGSTGDTIVIVPLVKTDSTRVTAFLACRVNSDSVQIKLFRADRFAKYPISNNTDSLTSTFIAHQIMVLDYLTYGYDRFEITDKRIFNYSNVPKQKNGSGLLVLKPVKSNYNRNASFVTVMVCWDEWVPPYGYQTGGLEPGEPTPTGHYERRCQSYTSWVSTTFENTPIGDGTDLSGGGGSINWGNTPYFWNSDPCDPTGGSTTIGNSDNPQCQDGVIGWQPLHPFFDATVEVDDFTNPCIVTAQNKIGYLNLNILGKNLLYQQNPNAQKWKIVFEENRNLNYPDGRPAPSESYGRSSLKEWHISLNPTLWEQSTASNATQELAGLAIIHEFTHGFIWVYRDFYNLDFNNLLFSSHEKMFQNCVEGMAGLLENAFNLSHADAIALALQGMDDVLGKVFSGNTLTSYNAGKNQFAIDHYGMSIPDAEAIFDQYSNGTKGTRCF